MKRKFILGVMLLVIGIFGCSDGLNPLFDDPVQDMMSGTNENDSGTNENDSGTNENDSGTNENDSGTNEND